MNISFRASWAHPLTAEEAARYTLGHLFGPAAYWGEGYVDWGRTYLPWDPLVALAAVPEK